MRNLALSSIALFACAHNGGTAAPQPPGVTPASASATSSPATTAGDTSTAPTPFTAAQIREACTGRTVTIRVEAQGKPAVRRTIRFVSVTPEDTETETTMTDDTGKPLGQPERARSRWEELRRHAAFPKDMTTITTDKVTTPAGTFATHAYKVVGEDGAVTTYQFADDLPGPPLTYATDKGGVRVMTATMIATSRAARP
jgi:hypothetical protein